MAEVLERNSQLDGIGGQGRRRRYGRALPLALGVLVPVLPLPVERDPVIAAARLGLDGVQRLPVGQGAARGEADVQDPLGESQAAAARVPPVAHVPDAARGDEADEHREEDDQAAGDPDHQVGAGLALPAGAEQIKPGAPGAWWSGSICRLR